MHITGHRDGPPAKVGVAITDLTTGLYTCNSIMAALIGRGRTGKGQHLDVALSDCQVASLANIASSCLISGKPDSGRWGTAHPSIVPYKGFKTQDGDVMLGGGNDRLFGVMCRRLGKEEWIQDPRFVTNADRVQNRVELESLVEEVTTTKTTQQWLEILDGSGMPYAAINDVKGTVEHEHGASQTLFFSFPALGIMMLIYSSKYSLGPRHGARSRTSILRSDQIAQSSGQIQRRKPNDPVPAPNVGTAYRRDPHECTWDE